LIFLEWYYCKMLDVYITKVILVLAYGVYYHCMLMTSRFILVTGIKIKVMVLFVL